MSNRRNIGWPEISSLVRDLDEQQATVAKPNQNINRADLISIEKANGRRTRQQELGLSAPLIAVSNFVSRFSRKRLFAAAGFVATVLAVFALATGITLARFSAAGTATNNNLKALTVVLSSGAPTGNCSVTGL